MPSSAIPSSWSSHNRPELLIARLRSAGEGRLKALRELKNQIIGNRTKKLTYIKLGAVPSVVEILTSAVFDTSGDVHSILIQSCAVLGSFACGVDAGVKAVLEAGAFSHLMILISHRNDKVVDAAARSLRMIYQSKLAPKYDFLYAKNIEFILSLLNKGNENVTGLGASIITHSCWSKMEQRALSDAGVLKKLVSLLRGSLSQRDASLESLASLIKDNPEVISKFVGPESGRALSAVTELTKDRYPRTRLLACMCLIVVQSSSPASLQVAGIKMKLITILLELMDDPGEVGDEAGFALSSFISESEDLQKLAFEANVVDRLCDHLQNCLLQTRRYQGILLALAGLCSKLECCRSKIFSHKAFNLIIDALNHERSEVRVAACICLKSLSRSVQHLSAGHFKTELIIMPLVKLLCDTSTSEQVAALGAISNIVIDFAMHKSLLVKCGGVKQLVQLSKSMDSTIRVNAVWALRNLMFLVDNTCKEGIFSELTAMTLRSLICDPKPSVQEQALGLVRNLVDGSVDSIEYMFLEDCLLLNTVGRQLLSASKTEVLIQGMFVLCNVSSGNEFHKEAVMHQLMTPADPDTLSIVVKFLQNSDSQLRVAAVWALVNLTSPSSPGAFARVVRLRNAGVVQQLKTMVTDPCLDVKLRVRTALGQTMTFDASVV
ncbi:hypothetical protein DCAR_0934731 [Daucus carota subsp. sativus]|uniref:Uncharacterized protein n=1 Tax=Daucus carota subsp. sativus TaxID=79200 RepID=A0A175YHS3_DAUCS|nr:PREDICTED: armadillo repeat-containing protein 8 [Daucus carota subsp. sativus]WOH15194.1 hypothetical protein DCAR_0934731 [Daucus carota subsp. sativus]